MPLIRKGWWAMLIVCLAGMIGCDTQDADRLARMGKRGAQKLQIATGDAHSQLSDKLNGMTSTIGEGALDLRVTSRLHWDKMLADAQIEVGCPAPGTVELKGTVRSEEQRIRAKGLAMSTAGVEKVIDSMGRAP